MYICEDLARYHELVEYLKGKIYALGDTYKKAKSDEDIDKCLHLSRLFTELGETLVEIICNHPGEGTWGRFLKKKLKFILKFLYAEIDLKSKD